MRPLAHSARDGLPAQTYQEHIEHVYRRASSFAAEADWFAADCSGQLQKVVSMAAEYHDLGKLDADNQKVLHKTGKAPKNLPVNHVDAGTAFLLRPEQNAAWSAISVYSHHRGLPNFSEEAVREENAFRDEYPDIRTKTDHDLPSLLETHHNEVKLPQAADPGQCTGDPGVFLRLSLSCIADADHSDTAESAGHAPLKTDIPKLRAKERLAALDAYIHTLESSGGPTTERNQLRGRMYRMCRDAEPTTGFVSCDSPVGSGKTTAVMAHLLAQAARRGLRRIFVILPYTNIIRQSVEVYRKALTLPGENPEEIVAELHHRADFDDEALRHLTALWRAPIIVTTAVSFFETLASNRPAALRRLHELPGSAIFVDEAHAALPVHLLSVTWHWMQTLAKEWSCYWLLASGSLVRFWQLPEIVSERTEIPELVPKELHDKLMQYEAGRVTFRWEPKPVSRNQLIQMVLDAPGPRLLIVNTVQSAAVLAQDICGVCGREHVEHLSTALTPSDRVKTIERIKMRLRDPADTDWTLVATSCVEAGVDFSFRSGFREAASVVSLLQTAGRVNRGGSMSDAEIWTFQMQDDPCLKKNPGLEVSADVLVDYLKKGSIPAPALSTCSLQAELHRRADKKLDLCQKELGQEFKTVAEKYIIIDSNTVPVVIDRDLAERFCAGEGDWKMLQKHSVSIAKYYLDRYRVAELRQGLYYWQLPYSSFLGYMEGIVGQSAESLDVLMI